MNILVQVKLRYSEDIDSWPMCIIKCVLQWQLLAGQNVFYWSD